MVGVGKSSDGHGFRGENEGRNLALNDRSHYDERCEGAIARTSLVPPPPQGQKRPPPGQKGLPGRGVNLLADRLESITDRDPKKGGAWEGRASPTRREGID